MRRIRPWVIVSGCLLALVAAAALVARTQGDLLRESAAHYLRERLAAEFGAQFQTRELRGRWFPPGLSLGRVTFARPGEAWVLTAEDVRLSFNLYAMLFQRERLGRVVLERPRLFVRAAAPAPGPQPSRPSAPPVGAPPALAARLRELLRPPFPLRLLEVSDGRAEVLDRGGRLTVAEGVDLAVMITAGSAEVELAVARLAVRAGERRLELGRVEAGLVLAEDGATVSRLAATGGDLAGEVRGSVGYAGAVALRGEVAADTGRVAAFLGTPLPEGRARFTGSLAGTRDAPEVSGELALGATVYRGRRLPEARGRVGWGGRRLTWSDVRVAAGAGTIALSGAADFDGPRPRYRLEALAHAAEPARLSAFAGPLVEPVLSLGGTLRWEGSGTGADAQGEGSLEARLTLAPWPAEELALGARATLAGGALSVGSFAVEGATVTATGSGSWRPGAGWAGTVEGAVGDVGRLLPAGRRGTLTLGGSASFSGGLEAGGAGPRFAGAVRLASASVGKLAGLAADARVELTPAALQVRECSLAWPSGRGGVRGAVDLGTGALTLESTLEELSLPEVARLLGADPAQFSGKLAAVLALRGTAGAPVVAGRLTGRELRFRKALADTASLSFSHAAQRFGVESLLLRRGATELSFTGELREGRLLAGTFESPAFDAADVIPGSRLDLAGSLSGRVRGPLEALEGEVAVKAGRLRYAGLDFRAGELSADYRGGTAALRGWLGAPENRLRAVIEPARGWRFESDLELRQLAPELVRSGAAAFPPALARLVGQASFLAAGRLAARGMLRDPDSVSADLELETLWLRASGQTLQNRAPVRLSWREGGVRIGDFRLAGEQYRLDLSGGGHLTAGWDLHAAGAVDLAFFTPYWPELEEVDGTGELQLALTGPWTAPVPEGSLTVRGAFVKARALPEPLEKLSGRIELRAGVLRADDLEGTIGGGAFRGRGSLALATQVIDGEVEGQLDLALFRGRVPAARDMRGRVRVRLGIAGALAAPAFSGSVEVVDAELFARQLPAKVTGLNGRLSLGPDRVDAIELRGQTGGGTIALTGSVAWGRGGGVALELRGEGILVTLAEGLKAQADLHLRLQGEADALRLAGEVHILKARYLREFTEKPPPLPAARDAAAAGGAGHDLSRMALDITVRATDNVWIANRMAKIEAAVALDVGGTLAAPAVRGEITAIRGEAFHLSRQFRLESGSLRFAPPATVPQLDLQASTTVGETQILFLMDGPLNRPAYHLVSLPAMSQEDLVALLTIGETRKGLARGGEGSSSAGAAVFTTEPLVNALGDEARSAMGLEVLQLEPVVGEDNRVSARLTLGTRLSDRMYVSYSQNLGATEDQQVLVQYYLLDYLSLWGQELRQGIYSLDLVFRYTLW